MRRVKPLLACAVLSAILSACASGGSGPRSVSQAEIDAHVAEASKRFDMPELWIREVIRQESGGRTTMNGRPIVSKAGAMGLMQVMPATYDEMRRKHDLGSDPYDPHDNIVAGTAYLREMYNLFGAPGFLGAYNCGPGCYGDYLAGKRSFARGDQALHRLGRPAPEPHPVADRHRHRAGQRHGGGALFGSPRRPPRPPTRHRPTLRRRTRHPPTPRRPRASRSPSRPCRRRSPPSPVRSGWWRPTARRPTCGSRRRPHRWAEAPAAGCGRFSSAPSSRPRTARG
ncbi:lytic transglycosylase domain-containing protein [Azospirillum doebereinerae]|uniref:lytic transglycosylase domain-containing protein n=1 Tax=Azospirillum doebereinerae TaxID=92933 RepID=UPI00384E81A7